MLKKIKIALLSFIAPAMMLAPVLVPATVHAASDAPIAGQANCGANIDISQIDSTSGCTPDAGGATDSVNRILKLVINIFSVVVGFAAVIMIIVGGFKYITSGGESNNISSAKNTILFAIVGLVIVALAQIIVRFVIAKAVST